MMKDATSSLDTPLVKTAAPVVSRLRWGIIFILLMAAVINYLDRANLSIANTTIAREFGFSQTEMGLLLSAFLWPYALANLPAGWLVDRFGPKKMFSWGVGLWSTFTVMAGFVNGYSMFYALRVLLGISESPFFTSGIKITHRWFSDKERALPTSIINTGSQIANAIAPPILTVLLLTLLAWHVYCDRSGRYSSAAGMAKILSQPDRARRKGNSRQLSVGAATGGRHSWQ